MSNLMLKRALVIEFTTSGYIIFIQFISSPTTITVREKPIWAIGNDIQSLFARDPFAGLIWWMNYLGYQSENSAVTFCIQYTLY